MTAIIKVVEFEEDVPKVGNYSCYRGDATLLHWGCACVFLGDTQNSVYPEGIIEKKGSAMFAILRQVKCFYYKRKIFLILVESILQIKHRGDLIARQTQDGT